MTRRALPGTLRATIAANMRTARQARGLSQAQLAHLAGMHRTYAGAIERAERNVSVDNIEKLAHALGVEPAELARQPDMNTRSPWQDLDG